MKWTGEMRNLFISGVEIQTATNFDFVARGNPYHEDTVSFQSWFSSDLKKVFEGTNVNP